MAKTSKQITGLKGENFACQFLISKGFDIVKRNYRFKRAEIDIIAQKDNLLTFVEVKTRKNNSFGYPEEFVSDRKMELFMDASENFTEEVDWQKNIRFDIIALTTKGDSFDVEFIEDAFY